MIFGNHVAKVKLVEQLTLVTLQTAHHGSTLPRFASTQRNHGSPHPSMTFATKSARSRSSSLFSKAVVLARPRLIDRLDVIGGDKLDGVLSTAANKEGTNVREPL